MTQTSKYLVNRTDFKEYYVSKDIATFNCTTIVVISLKVVLDYIMPKKKMKILMINLFIVFVLFNLLLLKTDSQKFCFINTFSWWSILFGIIMHLIEDVQKFLFTTNSSDMLYYTL